MKTRRIEIIGLVILMVAIGCYSAIRAQDEPASKAPPPEKTGPNDIEPQPEPKATADSVPTTPVSEVTGFKIGVVNIAEVFAKYNKTKDYEKLLEREQKKEQAAINEMESEKKKLIDELSVLNQGGDLYREKSERLNSLDASIKFKKETWYKYIRSRYNEHLLKLYKDIRETIDLYAKESGYVFIFKTDPDLSASSNGDDDVTQQISIRSVLYWPKGAEITQEIIKILNKEK